MVAETGNTEEGLLDRRLVVRELMRDRGELLVVSGLGSPTYDVFDAGDHDANFYLWGAMGSAALIGLGLALAQPARAVVVITGDGEQLMGLGGLATIGAKGVANLTVVVLDNGRFGETGMQLSHTAHGVDLQRIAAGAGFAWSGDFSSPEQVEKLRPRLQRTEGGPGLAVIRISPESSQRVLPTRDGVYLKDRFRRYLGFSWNEECDRRN